MGLFGTVPGCTRLYLALPRSAIIYLTIECHRPPLCGSNASVYTGLNAQKLNYVERGWVGNFRKHLSYEHSSVKNANGKNFDQNG